MLMWQHCSEIYDDHDIKHTEQKDCEYEKQTVQFQPPPNNQ